MPLFVSHSWIDPFSFFLEVNPILDFQRTFNVLKVSTIALPCHLTFNKGIRCLQDTGCIDQDTANRWYALRQLRNSASHPDGQSIIVPGEAIGLMARLADDINDLFSSE